MSKVRAVFKSELRSQLVRPKDAVNTAKQHGVFYRIPCECGKVNIGETGRPMQDRIKEHDRDIRLTRTETSAVSEHAHNTGHKPLWNEVKFIDRDPQYDTRRVKEAIHIRLHPNNINRDSGIEILKAWTPTIRKHNNRRAVRQRTTAWPVNLIVWRRLAVCSRNVAIFITRDYIVKPTKNLAFIVIHHNEWPQPFLRRRELYYNSERRLSHQPQNSGSHVSLSIVDFTSWSYHVPFTKLSFSVVVGTLQHNVRTFPSWYDNVVVLLT